MESDRGERKTRRPGGFGTIQGDLGWMLVVDTAKFRCYSEERPGRRVTSSERVCAVHGCVFVGVIGMS